MRRKEPLYRRVNTRTHGVRHGNGGEYRWSRNARKDDKSSLGSMHAGKQHGLDYTPLFRFLLSKIGQDWAAIHGEAVSRLDREEPIWWIVARSEADQRPIVRGGESTYYSGLYVDNDSRLQRVAPGLVVEDLYPSSNCCTHTFNGKRFTRRYDPDRPPAERGLF